MALAIVDLHRRDVELVEQATVLLYAAFRGRSAAWPDGVAARREVLSSLTRGKISRVMVDDGETVIGWIAAQPSYADRVWEIHPIVVAEPHRGRGIGRALVADLEGSLAARGALTLWAGSDDEHGETSLGQVDLYADLPEALQRVGNFARHPYEFFLRLGFRIVGVMPDANGWGKPDIFLAKRLAGEDAELA